MRAISSVHLINFQAHRDLEVDFSEFTGITGPTNKGKTAIIRGIFWCLYNSPSGTDFITKGESSCKVTVTFDDGLQIVRARGSKENSYNIIYPNGENLYLEGFGVGPTEDVVNAHGMRDINLINGKDNLNFCKQLDPPFFIGESPTTQALIIGLLGKTDVVDLSIKNTSSEIRSVKAVAKGYKEELKDIKAKLTDLRGLGMMEKAIETASKHLEKMEYINTKVTNIKGLTGELSELQGRKEQALELLKASPDVMECEDLISQALEINTKLVAIKKLNDTLESHADKYAKLKRIVDRVDEDEVNELIESIDEIIQVSKTLTEMRAYNRRLREYIAYRKQFESLPDEDTLLELIADIDRALEISEVLSRINPVNDKLRVNMLRRERGQSVIKSLDMEYEDATREYKEGLGEHDLCPLCGSDVDINKVEI